MPLPPTIELHRKQLARILATLFAMIGLVDGETVERLSSPIYRRVLRLLRPAESAVRRLIVVTARSITIPPARPRPASAKPPDQRKARSRAATFKLFDPRQRFGSPFAGAPRRNRIRLTPRPEPRLRVIDVSFDPRIPMLRWTPPAVPEPAPEPPEEGTVNALRLCRRLAALKSALENLPRQARRYVRWQSKPQSERRPQFASALRPGTPPGYRKNAIHKVDEILAKCDWLARQAARADTS